MALKKSDIKAPVLPKEAVLVAELGGEIIVTGLLLSDRLSLFAGINEEGKAFSHIPRVLASTVQDADGAKLFTEQEWEVFGAQNFEATLAIFAVSRRLSGLDSEAAEKN